MTGPMTTTTGRPMTDHPTTHAEPDDLLTRYAAALHELAAMANEDPSGPFADLVRQILAGKRWY